MAHLAMEFCCVYDLPWPLPGPPSVRTTPWRSLLSFGSLAEDGAVLMTGNGRVTWACRKLWLDSAMGLYLIGCGEGLKVSTWVEFGNGWPTAIWLARGEVFCARIGPLETTPGAWLIGQVA